MSIKLMNAKIDIKTHVIVGEDRKEKTTEDLIIHGVVDPDSLASIQVAPYQREILPGAKMNALIRALDTSSVPDITLGMRGDTYKTRKEEDASETFFLIDPVFVIDGLQRISAARKLMEQKPSSQPKIDAAVLIDTNEKSEAEWFRKLNQDRTKLNVNILLRNKRDSCPFMDMIYRLCQDETFTLYNRVQWNQKMTREQITTAMILCAVVGYLHSRFGSGRGTSCPDEIAASLNKTMENVGRTTMRDNIKTFFELIDECWGIRKIVYNYPAVYMKRSFLITLADVLTRHTDFWRGNRLYVERSLRDKIRKFRIDDPNIISLSSASGAAKDILYQLMLNHINSGKRTRRLQPVDEMEPRGLVASPAAEDPAPSLEAVAK